MSVRVKICGITTVEDAAIAVAAGADALGFMFYPQSRRHVTITTAAEIIRQLPPFVAKVGVFVDESADMVRRAIEECGLDTLQFHGQESPKFCGQFCLHAIKAFRVRGLDSLRDCAEFPRQTWLLDSYVPGQPGGTGAVFNWDLAAQARKLSASIILAGGLTPENVTEAIERVQPYAVDVSSGVESAPGKKDPDKLRRFIMAVRCTPATD